MANFYTMFGIVLNLAAFVVVCFEITNFYSSDILIIHNISKPTTITIDKFSIILVNFSLFASSFLVIILLLIYNHKLKEKLERVLQIDFTHFNQFNP